MSSGPSRPFVSVKFSAVGRTYTFLLPELALDAEGAAPAGPASRRSRETSGARHSCPATP